MADGRTLARYARVYANGNDFSGETRSIGPLEWNYAAHVEKALTWAVSGALLGVATIKTGTINTILRFDTVSTSSPHDLIKGMREAYVRLMVPWGIRTDPAMGDPTWMTIQRCNVHHLLSEGMYTITMDFDPAFLDGPGGNQLNYDVPWGVLLHAKTSETGANAGTGYDGGAQTTAGGWMMCQFIGYTGAGSATVTVQHADTNLDASFSDITDLTTGAVPHTSMPTSRFAQAATTATIKQYLRWQLTLTGLTGCSFVLAFARGR